MQIFDEPSPHTTIRPYDYLPAHLSVFQVRQSLNHWVRQAQKNPEHGVTLSCGDGLRVDLSVNRQVTSLWLGRLDRYPLLDEYLQLILAWPYPVPAVPERLLHRFAEEPEQEYCCLRASWATRRFVNKDEG